MLKKIPIAALLMFLFCLQDVHAETISDLQEELEEAKEGLENIEDEIDKTEEKIESLQKEVEKLEEEGEILEEEKEERSEAMNIRIQYAYENGSWSYLSSLLESDSLGDLLNRTEYLNMLYEYDNNALEEYEELLTDIGQNISDMGNTAEELEDKKEELENKKEDAEDEIDEIEEKVSEIQAKTAQSYTVSEDTSGSYGSYSSSDLTLLASIIQAEAGSTSYSGQLAVGSVIMNRVKSSKFPNTISGVVYQSGQFSPVTDGSLSRILSSGACSSAYSAAKAVLNGERTVSYLFFCADWYKGNISASSGTSIGGNYFYSY